uniref:Uncharacterized protein n=1 Tax=Meloidogyne enterolobii TaxID=390850 RepID=A0A6V7UA20_MELEN|nr:unnamed protein product [Meloidogyne enterolobii]
MSIKNNLAFPLILFFSIYLFFFLNWNFVESKNLESRKLDILKMKKILSKGGQKFNFNKTEKRILRKNNEDEGFFVDFALVIYKSSFTYEDYDIFYSLDFCYDEEKYFKNYCNLDLMSKPINATFDEQKLNKIVIFVDQVVDNKGETIINVGNNTEFELYHSYEDGVIKGNVKNIEKIAKALNALVDDEDTYYLNEKCSETKFEGKSTIGLKFKNSNTTINVSGSDIANYGYEDKCELGLGIDGENQLTFSSQIFTNYCVLFDTLLNQIAFAPRLVEPEDMKWHFCN